MNTLDFKAFCFTLVLTTAAVLPIVTADDYEAIEGGHFIPIQPPTSGDDDYEAIEGGHFIPIQPPTSGGRVDSSYLTPTRSEAAPLAEVIFPRDNKELLKCVKKVTRNCGKEIFEYVFSGGSYPSVNCCQKLLSLGKSCHDRLTENVIVQVPKLGDEIAKNHKNEQVWKSCVETKA